MRRGQNKIYLCVVTASVLTAASVLPGSGQLSFAEPSDGQQLKRLLDQECVALNKDKLHRLIAGRFADELERGLSPELLRIMEGVIKRTDFDGLSEEKTVELIGLVSSAAARGAPLEYLDGLFDIAYAKPVSVDSLAAGAVALKELGLSDVPQEIAEEFVYHAIEDAWDPAALPALTRGLIYGVDRGLTPEKVALIIMLDVKNGELGKKKPDQLVLDSLKLVREKEPHKWKPLSQAEKQMQALFEKKRALEIRKTELDEAIVLKERAIHQAEDQVRELREYRDEPQSVDMDKVNRDLQELIRRLQQEMLTQQQRRTVLVADLETTRRSVERQQESKDRERREQQEQDFTRQNEYIASYARQGRLHREKLLAAVDRYLGTPYRYGGDSEQWMDCSAFTRRVYRSQGVELPRSSREQSRVGRAVELGSVMTGDLLFFDTSINGGISHVGVYIGNGAFAHASSSRGVTKSHLREKYYVKRFVRGGRIFEN